MPTITVMDWLINKAISVSTPKEIEYTPNTYLVYKDRDGKEHLWEMLWYTVKTEKKWTYSRHLLWRELERFESNKTKAKELFDRFASLFKAQFPDSVPVTWRISLYGNQIYFYFYAHERYDFSQFVKEFRQEIKMKFFIYQVGARDRVRLHPNMHERFDPSWLPLMYSIFKHPLDQVESDALQVQWLRGRDIERFKDRSWKISHTMSFELDIYKEENKKYPEKWSIVRINWKKMLCTWFNILTQNIKLRWQDDSDKDRFTWEFLSITLDEYTQLMKKAWKKSHSWKKKH